MTHTPRPVADLVDATLKWRMLVVLTAILWTVGYVQWALERGHLQVPDEGTALGISVAIHLVMLVCFVGIVVTAAKTAAGLALDPAWKWGAGAWVPCCNPFVVLILSVILVQAYRDRSLRLSLLVAPRSDLDREI
jgi:bacteriorhodopsin